MTKTVISVENLSKSYRLGHIFYAKYSIQQEAAQNSPTPRKL